MKSERILKILPTVVSIFAIIGVLLPLYLAYDNYRSYSLIVTGNISEYTQLPGFQKAISDFCSEGNDNATKLSLDTSKLSRALPLSTSLPYFTFRNSTVGKILELQTFLEIIIENDGRKEIKDISIAIPSEGFFQVKDGSTAISSGSDELPKEFSNTISVGSLRPSSQVNVQISLKDTPSFWSYSDIKVTHPDGAVSVRSSEKISGITLKIVKLLRSVFPALIITLASGFGFLVYVLVDRRSKSPSDS